MNEFLIGGVGMLVISILLAWLVTFSRIFAKSAWAQHVDQKIILKGHIDFVLMSLFSFAFWATHIPVPKFAMWTMLIGGYTNPGIFLWLGLLKDAWSYSFVRCMSTSRSF
ncbi:hypothetical protein ACTMU2_15185 [Cupriavidus basilensis]